MKDELGGKILTQFAALIPKTYSFLTNNNDENKKPKDTKNRVIKRILKFDDDKNCLRGTQLKNTINQLQKNKVDFDNPKENHEALIKNLIS